MRQMSGVVYSSIYCSGVYPFLVASFAEVKPRANHAFGCVLFWDEGWKLQR